MSLDHRPDLVPPSTAAALVVEARQLLTELCESMLRDDGRPRVIVSGSHAIAMWGYDPDQLPELDEVHLYVAPDPSGIFHANAYTSGMKVAMEADSDVDPERDGSPCRIGEADVFKSGALTVRVFNVGEEEFVTYLERSMEIHLDGSPLGLARCELIREHVEHDHPSLADAARQLMTTTAAMPGAIPFGLGYSF